MLQYYNKKNSTIKKIQLLFQIICQCVCAKNKHWWKFGHWSESLQVKSIISLEVVKKATKCGESKVIPCLCLQKMWWEYSNSVCTILHTNIKQALIFFDSIQSFISIEEGPYNNHNLLKIHRGLGRAKFRSSFLLVKYGKHYEDYNNRAKVIA